MNMTNITIKLHLSTFIW